MAHLDAVDIGRDGNDAVRVVTGQIGIDAADGYGIGFLLRCTGSAQMATASASSSDAPAARRRAEPM
jgi:hypothetical protein